MIKSFHKISFSILSVACFICEVWYDNLSFILCYIL